MKEEFNPIRSVMEGKDLKGTAKITITNTKTGKSKTTVEENIVTNAVKDLFAANYSGLANFQEVLPVRNFFSGVLMFENEVTGSSTSYMPPAEDDNRMIACAGSESHSTQNPYRGNPDGSQTEFTTTSARFVWHWTEGQGNGDISCISLCPGILGNMGLKPFDNTYHPYKTYNVQVKDSGWPNTWERSHAIAHPMAITPGSNMTKSLHVDGFGNLHIIQCLHDLSKYGICRSVKDFDLVDEDIVNLNPQSDNFAEIKNFRVFETSTMYVVVVPRNKKTLFMYKVAKSNFAVTTFSHEVSEDTYDNATHQYLFMSCPEFPCNDDGFWWPSSTGNYLLFVSWAGSGSGSFTQLPRSAQYRMSPMRISNKLILGENFLYNSGTFYPLTMPTVPLGGYSASTTAISNCLNKHMVALFGTNNTTEQFYGLGTTNMFLSTINNLDVVRTKTSTDVMKLEYVIAEV